ncbi:MAG TPA: hypothetical protein VMR33_16385, partial [Candidatus Baltobacteraceae bacterium]|nr:hypothetical protein [Candidatus Baltobacteraceae bacterium]
LSRFDLRWQDATKDHSLWPSKHPHWGLQSKQRRRFPHWLPPEARWWHVIMIVEIDKLLHQFGRQIVQWGEVTVQNCSLRMRVKEFLQ